MHKHVPVKNVLESWRLLNRWFDPQSVGLAAASLSNILRPTEVDALRSFPMAIESWKEKMHRYTQKTGELLMKDATSMELLIAMCPNAFEDVIRSWLRTYNSACGVVEQLIFHKIQQRCQASRRQVGEAAKLELKQPCMYQPYDPEW